MKVIFCASRKPAVTESESQGLKARFLPSDVRSDGCDGSTTGWLSPIQARMVSKVRPPVASQSEPPPERPTEVRKKLARPITRRYSGGATITVRRTAWVMGRRETLDPVLKVNVFACPVHDSKQQFLGSGKCVAFAVFPPKKKTTKRWRDETTEVGPPSGGWSE